MQVGAFANLADLPALFVDHTQANSRRQFVWLRLDFRVRHRNEHMAPHAHGDTVVRLGRIDGPDLRIAFEQRGFVDDIRLAAAIVENDRVIVMRHHMGGTLALDRHRKKRGIGDFHVAMLPVIREPDAGLDDVYDVLFRLRGEDRLPGCADRQSRISLDVIAAQFLAVRKVDGAHDRLRVIGDEQAPGFLRLVIIRACAGCGQDESGRHCCHQAGPGWGQYHRGVLSLF